MKARIGISNRGTRSSLFTSFVSLLLCISMLLGTTFAWFTDTVTSKNNIIASGNLDVVLYHANDGTDGADKPVNANTILFDDVDSNLWEPGAMVWEKFTVANEGSLNLKYEFNLNALDATVVDGVSFASMLKVAIVDADFDYTRENVMALSSFTTLESFTLPGTLDVGEKDVFGIVIWWQPGANDNLFNMNNDRRGQEAKIEIGVNLVATQAIGEMDSFDDLYDSGAIFPKAPINMSRKQTVANKVNDAGLLTEDVSVGISDDDLSASVPSGVQLVPGTTELNLTVQTVNKSEANIEIDDLTEETVSVDVHMDGVAEDNTVPMQITLWEFVPTGLNSNNIKLYHVEDGQTIQMIAVPTLADLDEHNEFYYNAVTGDIVLSMATFSEVALVASEVNHWDGTSATAFAGGTGTEADPYLIANAEQLAYFRDIVDGKVESWTGDTTFEGEFVKLSANIYLNHEAEFNNLWDPIGWGYSYSAHNRDGAAGKVFKGTFDGDRYAIHGLWQNGWELEEETGVDYTYTNCGGGLFASVENATIKNLAMIDAIVTFECVEIGIVAGLAQGNCTFESIFIYDSKIANYQRATGGVVGEISPSYDAEGNPYGAFTFRKVMLDTSVVVGSLWGDFDTPVGGIIGARWDDANVTTVLMDTCDLACELDVYNDITSTYQWHAYRRAGMLIGNTDTPPADGKNAKVATADFLTCNDVDVYYTDWTKYNYCQFSNYNSSWPWVRVQAGENCNAYSNPRYGVPTDKNGKTVVDYDHVHADGDQCNVQIFFDQLYGGGQGVYGQSEHLGVNTDVKYLITYMHDDHVAEIKFIEENDTDLRVTFPDTSKLPHLDQSKDYEWVDRNGATVTTGTTIPAGNVRDVFYYLTEADKYFVHFVDKDRFYVAQYEFDPKTGYLLNGAVAPDYPPEVPGYYGFWEPYTLKGATHDVIVNAVYSKTSSSQVLTTAGDLFDLLGKGYELSMSQDLTGGFGSANQDIFCTVVNVPEVEGDTTARLDLNSFTLEYNGDSSANKNWTLFLVKQNHKFTVGDGLAGFGFLYFDLSKLNGNAKPCIFHLEKDATLILERGVVIEFRYPKNNSNKIVPFSGVSDLSQYSGLQIENITADSENIMRITVNARTVLVGDGSDARK